MSQCNVIRAAEADTCAVYIVVEMQHLVHHFKLQPAFWVIGMIAIPAIHLYAVQAVGGCCAISVQLCARMFIRVYDLIGHDAMGGFDGVNVPGIPHSTGGNEEKERGLSAIATLVEDGLDLPGCAFNPLEAFPALIVEGKEALTAQQSAVHVGKLEMYLCFCGSKSIGFPFPEFVGHQAAHSGAEACSEAAFCGPFQVFLIEPEKDAGERRMTQYRDGFEANLVLTESCLIGFPVRYAMVRITKREIVNAVFERYFQHG